MVSIERFKQLALSFPDVVEAPHFEKISFRLNKKIFATLSVLDQKAVFKLTEMDQSLFCLIDPKLIYPVPNKWGLQGWTIVHLSGVNVSLLKDLCKAAMKTIRS